MNKKQTDWITKTIEQIRNPYIPQSGPNWLGHTKGTQGFRIDEMLLKGATEEEMAKDLIEQGLSKRDINTAIKRVKKHIYHLRTPGEQERGHGLNLLLKEDVNGVWKFIGDNAENYYTKTTLAKASSNGEIPTREKIGKILGEIAPRGKEIDEEVLKSAIKITFALDGRKLRPDWWEVTKKNLDEWSKKG
ncbi:MAG: hypothetical protein AB1487_00465 [Thermodesulfobacteriota bacterium]